MTDGPIAIVSALGKELALLREATLDRTELDLGLVSSRAWQGMLDGHAVVLAECGMGKVAAAMLTTALFVAAKPRVFVFTGVAGGLDPTLNVGDVVIGKHVVQHDSGLFEPTACPSTRRVTCLSTDRPTSWVSDRHKHFCRLQRRG